MHVLAHHAYCRVHVVEHSTFQKSKGIGKGGSQVQILVRTIYYIIIKVFNFTKKMHVLIIYIIKDILVVVNIN